MWSVPAFEGASGDGGPVGARVWEGLECDEGRGWGVGAADGGGGEEWSE